MPCRIYAPVGTHKDLLGYLVRRLLENGANSSFVNELADDKTPIEKIVVDPVARIAALKSKPHPKIPLPRDIYGDWRNSQGIDLSNSLELQQLKQQMEAAEKTKWVAGPIINGKALLANSQAVLAPSDTARVIGHVSKAGEDEVEQALVAASAAARSWEETPVAERAAILERAADLFQQEMPSLMAILTREGGKCIMDCMSEVRETIDYCRYYAHRARCDLAPLIIAWSYR